MKLLPIIAAGAVGALTLTGCGQGESAQSTESTTSAEVTSTAATYTDATEVSDKSLVVYFSLAGEQYNVGVIEEGNTAIVAKMIATETGADLYEIEPVNEYTSSHSELVNVAREEKASNARPEIKNKVENIDEYTTIYVGYPNWWGDMPMIVYNFLESYDLGDKTIIPFCTHGGSGFSNTQSTIADITKANMRDGFAIAGEKAQNDRSGTEAAVKEWLQSLGVTGN